MTKRPPPRDPPDRERPPAPGRKPRGSKRQRIDDAELDAHLHDLAGSLAAETPASGFVPAKRRKIARVGSGQGGIVRRRGNAWRLQYRGEADANGRRKQHSVRVGDVATMSYEEARAAAGRQLEYLAPRRIPPGTSLLWEAWCTRFVDVYLPMQRTSSQQSTGSVIRRHLLPAFTGLYLPDIRVARIQTVIARWRTQGVAPATITTRYRVLRRMLRRARTEGLAVDVPTGADIDLPRDERVQKPGGKAFTTRELVQILAAAEQPWRMLFELCAFCGLRISEALALHWGDVDLAGGRLHIVRQAVAGREVAPKTRASVAVRRIPPRLVEHLREFGTGRTSTTGEALLFPSPHGGAYHSSGVRRHHLKPLLDRLGIDGGRSFHAFRHWAGGTAAREGVAMPTVQRVLRHRDPRSTQVYVDMPTEDIDQAIDAIECAYLRDAANVLSVSEQRNDPASAVSP